MPSKNDADAMDTGKYLFNLESFRKVSLIDYTDGDRVKKPKGLYSEAEFIDQIRYVSHSILPLP